MFIYYIVFLFFIMVGLVYNFGFSKKYNAKIVGICFFVMFLLSSLRAKSVGTDTASYIDFFSFLQLDNMNSMLALRLEIGFRYLIILVKSIYDSPQFFIVITSAIINFGMALYIYKSSYNVFLSVMIYYCFFFLNSMNIQRQYVAMAIGVGAIYCIKNKKKFKAGLCIVIGSLIHISAIVLLVPVILDYAVSNKKTNKFLITFVCIVLLFYESIIYIVAQYSSRMRYYVASDKYVGTQRLSVTVIVFLLLTMMIIDLIKKKKGTVKENNYYLVMSVISLGLSFISNLNFSIGRVLEVLKINIMFQVPYYIINNRKYKKIIYFMSIAFLLVYFTASLIQNGSGTNDYSFYFEN